MGYPEWFKAPAPPRGRVATAGYDTSALDVLRALTGFHERWAANFAAAWAALPKGPALTLSQSDANGILAEMVRTFRDYPPEEQLVAKLNEFYALLGS